MGLAATECDVYGAGGHAQVVIDVLAACGVRVRHMYNDEPTNQHPASRNVLPGIRLTGRTGFPRPEVPLVLAVGRNGERAELADALEARFIDVTHPTAVVAHSSRLGAGTVVLHGAIIQANARVGRHVLVNTAASIDHDCLVGDFAHISPRVTLCGHVQVGEGTHVGAGAVVVPKVRIGKWSRIGAGSVVLADVPDQVTVVGNPGRIVLNGTGERLPRR